MLNYFNITNVLGKQSEKSTKKNKQEIIKVKKKIIRNKAKEVIKNILSLY
jgi:vacuolar-type H+-ATPase subunit H